MASGEAGLTGAERDVLRFLWDEGPSTVRVINAGLAVRGRRWAYSTVATLIQRLAAKGYIATDSRAVPHVYEAAVSREEVLERRLRDTADELCDGKAAPLVLALVQGDYFTSEELDRLRKLIDNARRARGAGPSMSTDKSKSPKRDRRH